MESWTPRSARSLKDRGRDLQRPIPHARVGLLRADMEREAMGDKSERMRALEHTGRHFRRAAELARQRPFRAGAVAQDSAEHFRARRRAGDLLHLGLAIHGEQADPERIGARDVLFLLDRVAEADAVGRRASGQRLLDLGHRGSVEARAEPSKQIENLGRRIRLDGVEHARVGQGAGEAQIILAHDVEIDDEAGPIFVVAREELLDAVSHERHPPSARMAPRLANEGFAGDATLRSRVGDATRSR